MTYLEILVIFVVAPCLLLAAFGLPHLIGLGTRGKVAIPILALIAFVYTAPWDNYLIFRGVWDSPDDRILGRVGYVPIEEYLFFLLQPVLTGLWFAITLRSPVAGAPVEWSTEPRPTSAAIRRAGALLGVGLTLVGVVLLRGDRTLYLGAILAWTGPVLSGIWWYMGGLLWAMRRTVFLGVLFPTVYLWVVDRIALAEGSWAIAEAYTVGLAPFGLPVEEALFFLATNLMVVLGMVLLLFPQPRSIRDLEANPKRRVKLTLVPLAVIGSLSCGAPIPENVGVVEDELRPCPETPNCVRSGSQGAIPHLVLSVNSTTGWQEVLDAVRAMPRTRIAEETERYARAEVTSRVFRFVDDLELLWDPKTGGVRLRSASRVGESDLGVNEVRVRRLHSELLNLGLIQAPPESEGGP